MEDVLLKYKSFKFNKNENNRSYIKFIKIAKLVSNLKISRHAANDRWKKKGQ